MSDPVFQIKIARDLSQSKVADVAGLAKALLGAMDEQNALTVSYIQQHYASFPKDGPTTMDGLRAISGRLRQSYRASDATITSNGVTSDIGSNVVYAAIQEFGGQTKAHDIVARNGKALAIGFGAAGAKVFTAQDFSAKLHGTRGNMRALKTSLFIQENGIVFLHSVHHPGSDIPARQPIQRGIEDRLPEYNAALSEVIDQFFQN
jgi:phage gpG-like protein